jgi:hypothetical protein
MSYQAVSLAQSARMVSTRHVTRTASLIENNLFESKPFEKARSVVLI